MRTLALTILFAAAVAIAPLVAIAQAPATNPYAAGFDWGKPLTSDEVTRFVKFWSHFENLTPVQIAAMRSGNWATAAWATQYWQAYQWESARFSQAFYRASLAIGWLNAEKDGQDPEKQWAEAQASIKEAMNNPNVPAEYKQMMQQQMGMYAAMRPDAGDMNLLRPHYDRLIRIWKQFDEKMNND